jgi:hypothetical protein
MELEIIMLSETSYSYKEKHHIFSCLWKIGKNKTIKQIPKKEKSQGHESKRRTTRRGKRKGKMEEDERRSKRVTERVKMIKLHYMHV